MTNFTPTADETRALLAQIDKSIAPADWMLCAKKGCCTGTAECCKLYGLISWIEMELIWLEIENWTPAERRALLKRTKEQVNQVKEKNPELFDSIESADVHGKDKAGLLIEAMQDIGFMCPLLNSDHLCSVYESRPLLCRAFGHTGRLIHVKDEQGKDQQESAMLACDSQHQQVLQEHPDYPLPNFTRYERDIFQLAAPSIKMWRAPLVAKPIQFWIVDLADESGDITNPFDVFNKIRAMIEEEMSKKLS
jgi:Fe-S-cluster containining protein